MNLLALLGGLILIFSFCFGSAENPTSQNQGLNNQKKTIFNVYENNQNLISVMGLEGNEIPISIANGDQETPKTIYLKNKNLWFVIWADNRNGNNDIYGQFVNSNGTLCGTEIQLTNSTGDETNPTITYNNNIIVFSWQDTRGSNTGGYIYLNSIDISNLDATCNGWTLGTEKSVPYTSIGGDNLISRQRPDIKYDPVNDRYILVYLEQRDAFPKVICFSASNPSLITKDNISNIYVAYSILDRNLNFTTNNEIIRNDANSDAIRSREIISDKSKFNESHTLEFYNGIDSVKIAIDTTSNIQYLIYEAKKQVIEFTCNCNDENNNQTCDTGDTVVGTSNVLSEDTVNHIYALSLANIPLKNIYTTKVDKDLDETFASHNPDVSFDPYSKRFFIVFENEGANGNTKIYGQLLKSTGGLYGNNILISYQDLDGDGEQDNDISNSKQSSPSVEFDPVNQRFFVAWQDGRSSSVSKENLDIYGQYIDSEGSLRGNNYIISKSPYNQRNPSIAFNSSTNEYLAVWKDARNINITGSDIYGQRYSLGQPQLQIIKEQVDQQGNILLKALQPALLDFGAVQVNSYNSISIRIKNTGDTDLTIDCIEEIGFPSLVVIDYNNPPENSVYSFDNLPNELTACNDNNSIILTPGTYLRLTVKFMPLENTTYITKIRFISNANFGDTIILQGIGINNQTNNQKDENLNPPNNENNESPEIPTFNNDLPDIQTSGGCSMSQTTDYSLIFILIILAIILLRRKEDARKVA